jgi:YXWGXW repeat-containing protein
MRALVVIRSLLFSVILLALAAASFAQIGISVSFGPPALPIYEQPLIPGDGYIWTPGYWAHADDDYYWVPGTWVEAPEVGFFWTPGYWGWGGSAFFFHEGYWGPEVGFYGGINYGYGYFGRGYEGGRWENNHFYYNTTVNNVNTTIIHNTYNTTIVNNNTVNRVSFNGGTDARPSAREETFANQSHTPPVPAQHQHVQAALSNPELRASANHGKPPIAATTKPAEFKSSAVPAREAGAPYKAPEPKAAGNEAPPANKPEARTNANSHAGDLQPHKYAPPSNANANAAASQKYQQQQEKLATKQNQEHQKLQQQQERQHQQVARPNASEAQKQQLEQKHAQQTQQLEQKHAAQQQKLDARQQPRQNPPQNRPPNNKKP